MLLLQEAIILSTLEIRLTLHFYFCIKSGITIKRLAKRSGHYSSHIELGCDNYGIRLTCYVPSITSTILEQELRSVMHTFALPKSKLYMFKYVAMFRGHILIVNITGRGISQ